MQEVGRSRSQSREPRREQLPKTLTHLNAKGATPEASRGRRAGRWPKPASSTNT